MPRGQSSHNPTAPPVAQAICPIALSSGPLGKRLGNGLSIASPPLLLLLFLLLRLLRFLLLLRLLSFLLRLLLLLPPFLRLLLFLSLILLLPILPRYALVVEGGRWNTRA